MDRFPLQQSQGEDCRETSGGIATFSSEVDLESGKVVTPRALDETLISPLQQLLDSVNYFLPIITLCVTFGIFTAVQKGTLSSAIVFSAIRE